MYVNPNFKSKKALRAAVIERAAYEAEKGEGVEAIEGAAIRIGDVLRIVPPQVTVFSPGPFPAERNGEVSVEGPHYPKPHTWYARVRVVDGIVVKVLS